MDSSKRGRAGRKTFNREDEAEMKEQGQKGFPTDAERERSKRSYPRFQRGRGQVEEGPKWRGEDLEQTEGWKQVLSREELKEKRLKRKGEQMNGTVQERP